MSTIIAVNKPKGPTSHDIINQIRTITGVKKVGHAGTLDPLASGVLVIGIGREATKKLGGIVGQEKEYIATIKLGQTSTTDDEEGEKHRSQNTEERIKKIDRKDIKKVLGCFIGELEQVPPMYSAVKVNGKEAYKYARKGKKPQLSPRQVFIKDIKLLDYAYPTVKIRVISGKGVYIRSLARDIGKKLAVGGYLRDLVRIRVGKYLLADSVEIDDIA